MVKVSKKKQPLISVVVPVYKVEEYINKCVDSIINQTYKNLEIILVDDGSPDNCGKICDDYAKKDKRIKVIHKTNGGLSDARNKGIEKAKGEYIGFVDSDDWIHPKMYERLYELLVENNADISCCNLIRTYKDEIIKEIDPEIKCFTQDEYAKKFFKINSQDCVYYAWNKLYKKACIEKEQYPFGLTSEDVVGTYKALLKANKIVETNEIFYFYRYNPESITGKFSKKDFDLLEIWDLMVDITKKDKKDYLEMALLNRYRIDYTLLMRMAINLKYNEIMKIYSKEYNDLHKRLKEHKKILLKSPIPKSRKITIRLICWNYKFFVNICNIISKIR